MYSLLLVVYCDPDSYGAPDRFDSFTNIPYISAENEIHYTLNESVDNLFEHSANNLDYTTMACIVSHYVSDYYYYTHFKISDFDRS